MKKYFILVSSIALLLTQTPRCEFSVPQAAVSLDKQNTQTPDFPEKLVSFKNLKTGALIGIFTILCHVLTLIAHESSHAIATTILEGSSKSAGLHLLCSLKRSSNIPLFSLGKVHFYFNGLWGYHEGSSFMSSKFNEAIMLLAGGIGGALAGYALLANIATYCLYKSGNCLKKSFLLGLKSAFSPFKTITHSLLSPQQKKFLFGASSATLFFIIGNHFYGCTPNGYFTNPMSGVGKNGDGERVWDILLSKSSALLTPLRIGSLIGELTCFGLVLKNWLLSLREMRLNEKVTD